MKQWILSACCVLMASQSVMVPQEKLTPQEAYFLRRVTEFWKDRDYTLVKKQIDEFLGEHESSSIHNNLYALMGDILYQENNYSEALVCYNKIADPLLIEKTAGRKCQCLYLAGEYDEVIHTLTPLLEAEKVDHTSEMKFILGDSLFRKMRASSDPILQKELATRAKPFLSELFETSYKEKVLLPLAEIHRELKESKEAAPLYLSLAEKNPLQKEEFLLQAAALQLEFDATSALSTFQQVVDLGGAKASDAAYQELLLLFQQDRFADIVSRAPKLEAILSPDKKPLYEFCVGRSYFKLEQLPEAITHFTAFIEQEQESTPHKRAAFLTLIHCAQKTENSSLFDQVLEQFLVAFPQDEEAGKALLLHAQTALQKGNLVQASEDLNRLVRDFPQMPEQETLLYDQAILLLKTEKWDESRTAFISYLGKFPSTPHTNLIWSSIVHASVEQLKKASDAEVIEKKGQLASDLTQALTLSDLFSPDEEASYQFLLGQLMFDLRHFSESVTELNRFCQKYPHHSSVGEAYLLQAQAHRELKSEPAQFIFAAENALALSSEEVHKKPLRLQLFNAYLAVKEYEKAAETLYQTFMVDQTPVQQENQLWLAGYYLKKAETGDALSHERAVELYKKVFQLDDDFAVHFDPSQTYLEGETLKMAELLKPAEREPLLKSLLKLEQDHADLPWREKERALFELAKAQVELKQSEEALKTIEDLLGKEETLPSHLRTAALLEKSRLLLARCQPSEKNESNPMLMMVMSTLKDLQIQKQLVQEPVHLEAALDYADLRTGLAPVEARVESALFFLNRIKEDFHAKDDPINQAYHEARLRYPDKDQLYQTYMKCLEAEILSWETKLAAQHNETEKAQQSKEVAKLLFEEVLNDRTATAYLKERAQMKRSELE